MDRLALVTRRSPRNKILFDSETVNCKQHRNKTSYTSFFFSSSSSSNDHKKESKMNLRSFLKRYFLFCNSKLSYFQRHHESTVTLKEFKTSEKLTKKTWTSQGFTDYRGSSSPRYRDFLEIYNINICIVHSIMYIDYIYFWLTV